MPRRHLLAAALLTLALPAGAVALQSAQPGGPGAADPARVAAGTYSVDGAHTQVAFSVSHFGFNSYYGLAGGASGSLTIDPARPADARVEISIPIDQIVTTSSALTAHLMRDDFFDAANHPTATFRSTSVTVDGTRAQIAGELTLRGTTRPVTLDARFTGAGDNPMNERATVGFEATATIRRSEFGINYALPAVSDEVDLMISVAFEQGS